MPNWVANKMDVYGTAEEIARFRQYVKGENGEIDFNKIYPMPKELNLVSGSSTSNALAVYLLYLKSDDGKDEFGALVNAIGERHFDAIWNRAFHWRKPEDFEMPEFSEESTGIVYDCQTGPSSRQDYIDYGRRMVQNLIDYGCTDWYDWNVSNWGTKWNACYVEMRCDSADELGYYFETAWSAPSGVYEKLADLFPNLQIHVDYADEDLGNNCGTFDMSDGYLDMDYVDTLEFACGVWGYDIDEIRAEYEEAEAM